MHELSIVEGLLRRVEATARERGATAAHRIVVRIGELAGVDAELLAMAFERCRGEGLCAAATLVVERVPVRWRCPRCDDELPADEVLRCTRCDAPARLVSGRELELRQIELEVPDV